MLEVLIRLGDRARARQIIDTWSVEEYAPSRDPDLLELCREHGLLPDEEGKEN